MNTIDRLGLTLLHFLWQGAIIAAVYSGARRFTSRSTSRYGLACAALVLMTLAPFATFVALQPAASTSSSFAAPLSAAHPSAAHRPAEILTIAFDRPVPASYFPWIVAIWIAGALVCWFRLL